MKLDLVHDIQTAFRKTVQAYSFPGTIQDLSKEVALVDEGTGFPPALLLLAFMLLDGETTFTVAGKLKEAGEKIISRLTYAKSADMESADFIFVPDIDFDAAEAIDAAKVGTLIDPHTASTILLVSRGFSRTAPATLSGPGIETTVSLDFGREGNWIESRKRKNREYPLGVELMFVTEEGQLVCLPRTTMIEPIGEEH